MVLRDKKWLIPRPKPIMSKHQKFAPNTWANDLETPMNVRYMRYIGSTTAEYNRSEHTINFPSLESDVACLLIVQGQCVIALQGIVVVQWSDAIVASSEL